MKKFLRTVMSSLLIIISSLFVAFVIAFPQDILYHPLDFIEFYSKFENDPSNKRIDIIFISIKLFAVLAIGLFVQTDIVKDRRKTFLFFLTLSLYVPLLTGLNDNIFKPKKLDFYSIAIDKKIESNKEHITEIFNKIQRIDAYLHEYGSEQKIRQYDNPCLFGADHNSGKIDIKLSTEENLDKCRNYMNSLDMKNIFEQNYLHIPE